MWIKILQVILAWSFLVLPITPSTFAHVSIAKDINKVKYFSTGILLHDLYRGFEIIYIGIDNEYKVFNIYNIFNKGRPYSSLNRRIWLSALPSIQYGIISTKWHLNISYDGTFFIQRPVATTSVYLCSPPNMYHRLQLFFAIPLQKQIANNLIFSLSFGLLTKYSFWYINESYLCEAPFPIMYPSFLINTLTIGLQASAMIMLDRTHKQRKYNYLFKIDLGYTPIGYNAYFHPLLIRFSLGLSWKPQINTKNEK